VFGLVFWLARKRATTAGSRLAQDFSATVETIMQYRTFRATRSFLTVAAVLGAGAPTILAQTAGGTQAALSASPVPAAQVLDRAAQLLESGRAVSAQQMLVPLALGGAAELMTDAERARASELLSQSNARIRTLDPLEVSLQRAEAAIEIGDLRTAEAQTGAVSRNTKASQGQLAKAAELRAQSDALKAEMKMRVPAMLDRAVTDFNAGRYVESKAGLSAVRRSGAALSAKQSSLVEVYQSRILDLEQSQGRVFDTSSVSASVMQPGVVKKPEPTPEPALQETPVSAVTEVAVASQPPAEAVPTAQPSEPVASEPAVQPPSDQDLIAQGRKFAAQGLRAEADGDFSRSYFNSAIGKYNRLLSEFRDLLSEQEARDVSARIDEARVRMGSGTGTTDPLQEVIKSNQVIRQRAITEFENQQAQARRAIEAGDTGRARDLAVASRLTVNNARNAFSEPEFEEYTKKVDALLRDVDRAATDLDRRDAQQRAEDNKKLQEQEREAAAKKREGKIREALTRARELQQQMDYDAALQVVNEQILFLDPINPAGLILRDILMDAKVFSTYHSLSDRVQRGVARLQLEEYEALIPPRGIVDYPPDWPAISYRRGEQVAYAETEENRRVRTALTNRREPVDFGGVRLADAVEWVRQVAKVGIDVNWSSLEAMQVTPDSTVTLQLTQGVPLKTILDKIVQKVSPDDRSKVGWAVEDGMVTIASEDVLRKNTPVVIYDIKDLLIEIPNYSVVPSFDLASAIQSSQGGGTGSSPFREAGGTDQVRGVGGAEQKTREDRIRQIVDIVEQTIDPEGWRDLGGTTGSIQELNGSLIITNTPTNHQAISGLLAKLREVRAMQINVETRFLLVSADFFESIGFDLDVYFNANNNQVSTARATNPNTQASDFFSNGRLQRTIAVPNAAGVSTTQGVVPPRRGFSPIGVTQNSQSLATQLMVAAVDSASVAGQTLGGGPAMGIAGQFLDDIQVDFLVTATQADRRSVRLNAPRLTFTNGQTSNIIVATQQAFVSDLSPVVSDSAVGFDPTTAVTNEGVRLLVEGTVSADRRYVTLNVDTSVSKIDALVNFPVTAVAGGALVSSADTQSFIQLPTVTVTSVATTVTVPDQGTVLLGGQRLVNEYETESGVPVLSKIPIINRFFSNRVKAKDEQTLLILLKPTILIQSENEDQNFPGLVDALRTPFGT